MSEHQPADGDASQEADDDGPLHRAWQSLRAAGQWVADTFRGHSGAQQLKRRER